MISSFALTHGALQRVERLDAEVMLFSNPDAAERDLLHSHYKVDEHALASALDPDEVSRIQFHPDHLFLIWKRRKTIPAVAAWRLRCRPAACFCARSVAGDRHR